jgi:hypothetical protein
MTLIAKPLVKNKLWIVVNGQLKVGNVKAEEDGYVVNIGKNYNKFSSTDSIEEFAKIEFERPSKTSKLKNPLYSYWPTNDKTHNDMFDIKRKIHLYTKTQHSKSYYASGWYKIKVNNHWNSYFCPKYILIQRYSYVGPFMTKEQADNA